MRRWVAALAIVGLSGVPLRADVTVTTTTTMEGAFAGMMGGMTPRVVMRIKGSRSRADIDVPGQTISTITDLEGKRIIILNNAQKTAQILTAGAPLSPGGKPFTVPKMDASVKPTGRSQTISGNACDEFAVTMSMSMGEMGGSAQMPAEAGEMMKSIRMVMSGTMWIAKSGPGVAEFAAFQAASVKGEIAKIMGGMAGFGGGGLDRMMGSLAGATGLPYLTELTMTMEGSGPIVEMMKQQGPIKMTTRVTEVSTDTLADDLFNVPNDYKVTK